MYAEIGNFFLYISLILTLFVFTSFIFPEKHKNKILIYLWGGITLMTMASFFSLIICYVISDYSVLNVLYNSHELKPFIYKVAGSWSNHEGSMLLWIISVNIPTFLFAVIANKKLPTKNLTLTFQGVLSFLFILYTITASNPFERIIPAPVRGLGMNPLLQDVGVSFHPPILYLGYVGFSLVFSSALAVLILKNKEKWEENIRLWILYSWIFLTFGIGSGAWWAYRELGWGGFWFWDPVENASLIPWITATALVHSIKFSKSSKLQFDWSILLSIITFTLVMIGTFIVRSGSIASVHSFTQDSERGIFILISIAFISGLAFLIYALNIRKIPAYNKKLLASKYVFLNNSLLLIVASIVSLGTILPVFMEVFLKKYLTIGSNYYNSLIAPISFLLLILCTIATSDLFKILKKSTKVVFLLICFIAAFAIIYILKISNLYSILGVFCSTLLFMISALLILKKKALTVVPISLGHLGFALLIFSISVFAGIKDEVSKTLTLGEKISFRGLDIKLDNIKYNNGANYFTKTAELSFGKLKHKVYPEIRFYPVEKQQTAEIDTVSNFLYDIYFSINSTDDPHKIMVNIQYNPMINFIWISALMMCIGGLLAILVKIKTNIYS